MIWARDVDAIPALQPILAPCSAQQIVTDKFSNVYSLSILGGQLLILKHNKNGVLIWSKVLIISYLNYAFYNSNIYSIDVDQNANIFISGMFDGSGSNDDFDPGPGVVSLPAAGYTDLFIEKLDSSGALQWIKQLGGINSDYCGSMKVDKQNNIFFTGRVWGTVNFDPGGPGAYNSTGANNDMFICKLSNSGNLIKFSRIGQATTNKSINPMSLTIDNAENVVISGQYSCSQDSVDFDPGSGVFYLTPPILTANNFNSFVLKFENNLDFKWAKQVADATSSSDVFSYSVGTDPSGNIYFTGNFNGVIDADPGAGINLLTAIGGFTHIYIIKLNANGVFCFGKVIGTYNDLPVFLAIDKSANIFLTGRHIYNTDFDPGPGVANFSPVPASTSNAYIVKLNSMGEYLWYKNFRGSVGTTEGKAITVDSDNYFYEAGNFDGYLYFGNSYLNYQATQSPDVFISKVGDANNILGKTFYDNNNNGIKDPTEFSLTGVLLKASSSTKNYYTISDAQGLFNITTDTGQYTITIPQLPLYYSSSIPVSQSSNFGTTLGQVDSLNNFGMVPVQNKNDLKINLTNVTVTRTGRDVVYRLSYKNLGTTIMSGTITLQHASQLNYTSSSPVASNYTNPVITWNFNNLNPSSVQNIDIVFHVPSTIVAGTNLQNISAIYPIALDETPVNNRDTFYNVVRSSYDPNDKSVIPTGNIFSDFFSSGEYLDYTIRFQNTGTDTAFNIIIRDTLSSFLNLSSLEIVAASHTFSVSLNNAGMLEWDFANILLPDSTQDEPKSHGFVRFRIKPKNTLQLGNQIKNTAYIGFDFNSYVKTNETINTYAASYISAADGNWNNPGTWQGGAVPPADVKVTVRHHVTVTQNASCYSLAVDQASGIVTVKTGVILNITN